MSGTTSNGRIFAVNPASADIIGFDPARDKLDLGDFSVHNFIVVDTPTGVGFMDPWSGETIVVQGVSLGQLTIDSFLPVINDHLRQCLSGALAWEHGVTAAPNTVYARSHEIGQVDRVAFNPARDVVDFRYYGSREQIYMTDTADGVAISNAGTGQALILLGVTKAQLSVTNFLFYPAEVREDRVHLQLGFPTVPDAQVVAQGVPVAGTTAWPRAAGPGTPPSGEAGATFAIEWRHGTNTAIEMDPATDKLDFGWFKAHEFSLTEVNGSTVITIEGNRQTYTLTNTGLGALEMSNIIALDAGARAEWQAALDAAPPAAALPSISIGDARGTEGDSGTTNLVFAVTLSAAAATPVSVSYSTANGTARAGEDYSATIGTITFAPGQTRQTITVPVLGDATTELTETLRVQLSTPRGATILDGSAVGTILDNDVDAAPATLPAITIQDYTTNEGDAGLTHMHFVLTLSKASTQTVTVRYATADVTATADVDYERLSGTVTFAPGETRQTIHAHINGDTVVEPTETYRVLLSTPTNATIADGDALVTIVNDDTPPMPTLSIADAQIVEGNSGSKLLNLTVTLSQTAPGAVTVGYATANGTATAGSDFTAKSGTLTFAAGETRKTIQVAVLGDTAVEANETFRVTLSNPTGATIADGTAIATITNDDTAAPPPAARLDYEVTNDWGSGFTAAMTVEAGASALNGWTATFDAGFTISNIWNAVIVSHVGGRYVIRNQSYNGTVPANGETSFGFQAAGGASTAISGLTLNGVPATTLPAISVADVAVLEGASGSTPMDFVVSLSAAAAGPVSVAYATSNGTAAAGSDYAATSGTLTFAAGETSKIVRVSVTGDRIAEANETLRLTLSGATGATIGDGVAIGTIRNDDGAPAPSLAVRNASVTEGNAGTKDLNFTVALSAPATGPVTVSYATANGTATAGADYIAKSGTLTFAPGETTKVVAVSVIGDAMVEANETVRLTLSAPSGATTGTATGTGTIVNDDVAPLPTIAIRDAAVLEGDPGTGGGWFSTQGNQIVDAAGNTVQIAGVNWFGFEGTNMSPNGLWTRGYKDMMQQMLDLGFNTIRLPFSSDMLDATGQALGIDYSSNPDLRGLTPLQVMDRIVAHAEEIGIRIILDHHRSDAGNGATANGLWYNARHPEADWIADWRMLAERYADNPAVIGADLHNEPYNGRWGGGGATDWAAAAERAGNAIGAVNPNWLIFVEGVASHQGQNYWWGGNLMGVRDRPIQLDVANKLVYSAHDYPNSIYPQPWFQGADFPGNLTAKFDQFWGYIFRENIAPVYIGEFGTKLIDPKDAPWFEAITSYIAGDFDNDGTIDLPSGKQGISWTYWSWNPNSGDTGGILQDDWRTVHENKMAYLRPISFDLPPVTADGEPTFAAFEVTLSAPATTAVTVAYRTEADSATEADFAAASGTVTFAAGEQSKVIRIAIRGDEATEGNEAFRVLLSNPVGATIADGTAVGTIVDDESGAAAISAAITAGALRVVSGTTGNDLLVGGNAVLVGGAGRDTLEGGMGLDVFRWDTASHGRDVVRGFVGGEDLLWIDASGFGGGLVAGMDLAATGRFVLGTAPTAARGQLLYDQATGALGWDRDGAGASAAVPIATFAPGTALAASDVIIVA